MRRADLDGVARLFDRANDGSPDEEAWALRFQEHIAKTMKKHGGRMRTNGVTPGNAASPGQRQCEVLRARMELYEIVEERLEARVKALDPNLAQVFRTLRDLHVPMVREALDSVASARPASPIQDGCASTLSTTAGGEQRQGAWSTAGRASPGEWSPHNAGELAEPLGGLKAFVAANVGKSQRPGSAEESPRGSPSSSPHRTGTTPGSSPLSSPRQLQGWTPPAEAFSHFGLADAGQAAGTGVTQPALAPTLAQSSSTRSLSPQQLSAGGYSRLQALRKEVAKPNAATRPEKELSLRQLRDVMSSVYASKAQHDARIRAGAVESSMETMEQHLYSYLSKRYGFISVVVEWAQAIFRTVHKHASREVDVLVFGRILQNSLPECFVEDEQRLRETVQQLLRNSLQRQLPACPRSELDKVWRSWMRNGVPLRDCEDAVRFMYNEGDADEVMTQVRAIAGNPESCLVVHKDFLRVLLLFQISLQDTFLAGFNRHFLDLDPERFGSLSNTQLKDLIQRVATETEELDASDDGKREQYIRQAMEDALSEVHARGSSTYSECVRVCRDLLSVRWSRLDELFEQAPADTGQD